MKAFVVESELYPYYCLTLNPDAIYEEEINVDEQTLSRWKEAAKAFFAMQDEIKQAISDHQLKQKEIEHLADCFAKPHPSRMEKGYVLGKLGWEQIDTSLWVKDGRQVRLHEAYIEAKTEFENSNCTNGSG